MGVEMWVHKDVSICSVQYRNKHELERAIKECEEDIANYKARLKNLVFMTEPRKFMPDSVDDPMFFLDREFEELMEEYDDARIKLTRLWEFEEAWDETHDAQGRFILPVNPMDIKKSYMGGDYAEYILEDGSEVPEDWWDVLHGFIKPEESSFAEKLGLKHVEPEVPLEILELREQLANIKGIPVNLDEL